MTMSNPELERTPMTNDAERVSDIVAKLRALAKKWGFEEEGGPSHGRLQVADEAADIIEAKSKALAEARAESAAWANRSLEAVGALRSENAALRAALTFYSGKPSWRLGHDNFIEPDDALLRDCGERARAALTPTPENPNG